MKCTPFLAKKARSFSVVLSRNVVDRIYKSTIRTTSILNNTFLVFFFIHHKYMAIKGKLQVYKIQIHVTNTTKIF